MKHKWWLTFTLALLVLTAGLHALAGEKYDRLLEMAILAPKRFSYSGTMVNVTWSGQDAASTKLRFYHAAPGQSRWEVLDDEGQVKVVVIEDFKRRWEIYPAEHKVYVTSSLECCLNESYAELARLNANYEIRVNGTGQVAGRETVIISLRPRFSTSPARLIWLDTETGVVLRWEEYSGEGSLTELGVFTDFRIERSLDSELFHYHPGHKDQVKYHEYSELPQEVVELQKRTAAVIRYPSELPPGYRFSRGRVLSRYAPNDTVQLQFTDGLNCISIFQTFYPAGPLEPGPHLEDATRMLMNNTPVYLVETPAGYVLSWTKGNVAYHIVGDIPIEQIRALAHSLGK
ncbi:MAG: hypothetical protein H0Z38_02545 [Firmicutes bacterium]|nr:hypothetical protein [Bacillota bacterium]